MNRTAELEGLFYCCGNYILGEVQAVAYMHGLNRKVKTTAAMVIRVFMRM
jgi:hypothetical protein